MRQSIVAVLCLAAALTAASEILWHDDFSDVEGWVVITDPHGDASLTSDGNLATFTESSANAVPGRCPAIGPTNRVPFNVKAKDTYALSVTIHSLTLGATHKWALDEFSADGSYLNTVWDILPTGVQRCAAGYAPAGPITITVDLGQFNYHDGVAYISPKLDLSTRGSNQALVLDDISITGTLRGEPRR
ncbi:MAG: hypothetical protein JXB04_04980 [Kiritimatiellae bacterium]|nr:hypothetical protein [Kiritimatiellia bacterium]